MPSKTVRILLSAVTALCTLCGCAEKADSLALTVSKENIEQRTEEIAGYLLNNDMDSVSKYLSDDAVKKEYSCGYFEKEFRQFGSCACCTG